MMKKGVLLSLVLSFMLVITMVIPTFATAETLPDAVNGEDVVDEVVEEIIEAGGFTRSEEIEIEEDIETLDDLGLPIDNIKDVDTDGGEIVYTMEIADGIEDDICVELQDEDVLLEVTEGEKHDELLILQDGTMFLDGEEIIVENEIEENGEDVAISTGGITWYTSSKAPSYLKNASYNTLKLGKCIANVKLAKMVKDIAIGTLCAILLEAATGGAITFLGVGKGILAGLMSDLVQMSPNTKNFSYKDYYAKGKNNARYYKAKRVIYTKINYCGKSSSRTTYGLMM